MKRLVLAAVVIAFAACAKPAEDAAVADTPAAAAAPVADTPHAAVDTTKKDTTSK